MERYSKLVAVFDDDQDLLNIFRFLFEDEGFNVQTFQECDHVVEKVRAISPDLILMDNWIPSTGGEVAVQQLKSQPDLKDIPVIYVSANNDIKEIAARAGADRFLPKPFEFDDLLALANELLEVK
ncbi:response regulator [Pedobacter sp.]|uniref:response regulator n=1 Tax=Pedobacter sp. TaxID=1411316 RepID=UPI0031DE744A